MGIKGDHIQVSENEVEEFSGALASKDRTAKEQNPDENKKVREHFYVNEKALEKLKKYVLLKKLDGEKISKSSVVNTWLIDFVKTLDV